ncbi:MAG: BAX inhibitor (BI)-1/YccA family protein, partial [Pseudomonadota bacterium]
MVDYNPSVARGQVRADVDEGLRAYLSKVYMLMAVAMVLTAGVAYFVGTNEALMATFFQGPVRWVVMFAPLI